MSLALGAVALDFNLRLHLTTNTTRQNLIRVERGEATGRARTSQIAIARQIEQQLPQFLQAYNYSAALAELNTLLATAELQPSTERAIRQLRDCCLGFDAWDRFDHAEALSLLEPYGSDEELLPPLMFLRRVITSRAILDCDANTAGASRGHGYELVQDLLLNAERCAHRQRYDDAVGRLYRALELLAQLRLKLTFGIDTGNVDLDRLPESLRTNYKNDPSISSPNGKIQLALARSYALLSAFSDDAVGQCYTEMGNRIQNALQIRNYSLFAHGFQPIDRERYAQFQNVVTEFIESAIGRIVPPKQQSEPVQFPSDLLSNITL